MSNRISGLNSLGYTGVEATTPPQVVLAKRAPTTIDYNHRLGTLWVTQPGQAVYILLGAAHNVGSWGVLFSGSSGGTSTFVCDAGSATEVGSTINIIGEPEINTSGSGNTVTTDLSDGTNGQLLLGGGLDAKWATITSNKGTISFTPGVNSLNVEVASSVAVSFPTDSGTAHPAVGVITMHGTNNITTTGSGNTITINTTTNMVIPGTLTIDSLTRGIVQANSSGELFSSEGTDGQVLISSSTGVPSWANITSNAMTLTITNGSNSINVEVSGGSTGSSQSFLAIQSTNTLGVSPAGVLYELGNSLALTEIVDTGGNVFPGNGTSLPAVFVAPLTGKYYLKISSTWGQQFYAFAGITTNSGDYYIFYSSLANSNGAPIGPAAGTMEQYIITSLNAGDAVTFGAKTTGGSSLNLYAPDTSISGFFIC